MTGLRGALATVERKLHDFSPQRIGNRHYIVIMALMRHRGEGATEPGQRRSV